MASAYGDRSYRLPKHGLKYSTFRMVWTPGITLTHRAKPATLTQKVIASSGQAVNCLAPLLTSEADPISFQR